MKKRIVSILLAGVLAAGTLAGCGNGKTLEEQTASADGSADTTESAEAVSMAGADEVDGTEITFWHSMGGVNGQAIDELVKRFNEENELGIAVTAEYQ